MPTYDEIYEANRQHRKHQRDHWWELNCPENIQDTDLSKLRCSKQQIEEVLAWPIKERGLRLVGATGSGKTRLAWLLMRNTKDFDISVWDAAGFGIAVRKAYMNGTEEDFYSETCSPRLFFLDDLGKAKFTARSAEALFTIVDRRFNADKPMLFTTNHTMELLEQRLIDRGGENIEPELILSLTRRIVEACPKIVLTI
jgi:DNA replication protein DnaC